MQWVVAQREFMCDILAPLDTEKLSTYMLKMLGFYWLGLKYELRVWLEKMLVSNNEHILETHFPIKNSFLTALYSLQTLFQESASRSPDTRCCYNSQLTLSTSLGNHRAIWINTCPSGGGITMSEHARAHKYWREGGGERQGEGKDYEKGGTRINYICHWLPSPL